MQRGVRRLCAVAALPLLGAQAPDAPVPAPICHAARAARGDDASSGLGKRRLPNANRSPQAQAYFNNGMQLAHAFAHEPAVSAFRRAE